MSIGCPLRVNILTTGVETQRATGAYFVLSVLTRNINAGSRRLQA